MAEWTQDAYEYLDGYLKQVSALAKRQGDDAEDIVSGLRDHIVQECENSAVGNVEMDDLLHVLSNMGTAEEVVGAEPPLHGRSRPTAAGATVAPHNPAQAQAPQQVEIVKKSSRLRRLVIISLLTIFCVFPFLVMLASFFYNSQESQTYEVEVGGHIERVEIRPFDPTLDLPEVKSPLHHAAKGGHIGTLKNSLNEGADINAQDEFGKTALHYASENGHKGMTQDLLDRGADANTQDAQGYTALDYALDNGHSGTAGVLGKVTTVAGSASTEQRLNPKLKYPDRASFEQAIGQSATLLKSEHLWLFAPKSLEEEAKIVHSYLVKAYDALYDIVGEDTQYIMVVYNFPKGHREASGGTSNCTIYYDDTNLRLNQHEEWNKHGIPHVSGYIEEMAHNFNYTQFGWEMVGWSIGIKASIQVADNPAFRRSLEATRKGQSETSRRYQALDYTFPSDIAPNQVDRIHAYLLWECEQNYGETFWHDFFQEAVKDRLTFRTGERDECYRASIRSFEGMEGVGMVALLKENEISITTDIKSLNPEDPSWNRKLR